MSDESLNNKYVDLVAATRGEVIENIHQGIAIAIDSNYRIIKQWGLRFAFIIGALFYGVTILIYIICWMVFKPRPTFNR